MTNEDRRKELEIELAWHLHEGKISQLQYDEAVKHLKKCLPLPSVEVTLPSVEVTLD